MSAQNSAGIQTLLDSERDAQLIVNKAREYRTKRIKDAKTEAQKEIDDYREEKEAAFIAFQEEHSSGNNDMEKAADLETKKNIEELNHIAKTRGNLVVEQLVDAVVNVHHEPAQLTT